MPAINKTFNTELPSPFFRGFEKLCERSEKHDMREEVSRTRYSQPLNRIRYQAMVAGRFYFPDATAPLGQGQRALSLSLGLNIGLCAGFLTVPKMARGHFAEVMVDALNVENGLFVGYHTDTDDIEEAIKEVYFSNNVTSRLPRMDHEFLDWVLEAGVAWAGQLVDQYHEEYVGVYKAGRLWRMEGLRRKLLMRYERDIIDAEFAALEGIGAILHFCANPVSAEL